MSGADILIATNQCLFYYFKILTINTDLNIISVYLNTETNAAQVTKSNCRS
jgi:hypothetical protein